MVCSVTNRSGLDRRNSKYRIYSGKSKRKERHRNARSANRRVAEQNQDRSLDYLVPALALRQTTQRKPNMVTQVTADPLELFLDGESSSSLLADPTFDSELSEQDGELSAHLFDQSLEKLPSISSVSSFLSRPNHPGFSLSPNDEALDLGRCVLAAIAPGGANPATEIDDLFGGAFGAAGEGDAERRTPVGHQPETEKDSPKRPASGLSPSSASRVYSSRKKKVCPDAPPSRYCHICQRTVGIIVCGNIESATCRKATCQRCFEHYDLGTTYEEAASAANGEGGKRYICTHCRSSCPENARCVVYMRAVEKRRRKRKE